MATINYVTKDGGIYDEALVQNVLTNNLVKQVDFVNNTKSFTLTNITTSGYQAHTRAKGFNAGTYGNEKEVYTITQDRDIEFYVDSMDVDETNQDLSMANITRAFVEKQAAPEVDAYRFMKLAEIANTNGFSETVALTKANVYTKLKDAIKPVRRYGSQNLIGYLSSEAMDLLERSEEFNRNITNQNVGTTALESRVTSLDGVTLIEVWDEDRFNATQDFTEGFEPTGNKINFIVCAVPEVIAVAKHQAIFLFAPGEHTQGDGWLYQNRLYHDLIVPKNQINAVTASLSEETAGESGGDEPGGDEPGGDE